MSDAYVLPCGYEMHWDSLAHAATLSTICVVCFWASAFILNDLNITFIMELFFLWAEVDWDWTAALCVKTPAAFALHIHIHKPKVQNGHTHTHTHTHTLSFCGVPIFLPPIFISSVVAYGLALGVTWTLNASFPCTH